jgi:hypothetical protein
MYLIKVHFLLLIQDSQIHLIENKIILFIYKKRQSNKEYLEIFDNDTWILYKIQEKEIIRLN